MQNEFIKHCYKSNLNYKMHYVSGINVNGAYSVDLHYDTDLTVTYFKEVAGKIKIEGSNYVLSSGDMVILNYNELHCVEVQSDFCERYTLYLDESIYRNYGEAVSDLLSVFYRRKQGKGNLIQATVVREYGLDILMGEIKEYAAQQDPVSELIAFGKITELLKILQSAKFATKNPDENRCTNDPIIDKVIKYIGIHFTEEITCESIAKEMYLSKYYLGRMFKEVVGISLWNYIINRRLLHFNDLIRQGFALEEACNLSGFHNYSNFYRLYKSRMGMSPQAFKRYTVQTKNTGS